jgi:CBS domain-containing protein/anti-sigma regulatory factor (Ser/Thr protein kinase)
VEQAKEISKVQELVHELKIEEVMTKDVITVTTQTSMAELREILRQHRISGVPVLENDKLVGVISVEDLIKALANGGIEVTVGERVNRELKTLYADEPLVRAVNYFSRYGFGRFPIIDRTGKLVGILTKGDIIRGLLRKLEVEYQEEEIHRYRASHLFEDIVADQTTLVFRYEVVGQDFGRAGEAASKLKRTLSRLGIDPRIIRRAVIAAYEAEMNIVVFTEGGELVAEVSPERIRIEAFDDGPGIADIEQAMQPGFSTAPEWVREMGFGAGMGLTNIQNCSDGMRLESTVGVGTALEAVFRVERERGDADRDRG